MKSIIKKLIKISSILFSGLLILTLTGCSVVDEHFKDGADQISISGLLSEQSDESELSGSHILTDENGDVKPVRSLSINLGSDKYMGNMVQLLGFDNDGVFEAASITVLDVLNQVPFEEVELLTYENDELGFSLDYYSDWDLVEGQNGIAFKAPVEDEEVSVDVLQFPYDYYPTEFEDGSTDSPLTAYFVDSGEDVTNKLNKIGANGLNAVKFEGDLSIEYYLYRNGLIYHLTYRASSDNSFDEFKNEFYEMLLGFKFTVFEGLATEDDEGVEIDVEVLENSIDIEASTYESLPYHFRGQYPADWWYAGNSSTDSYVLYHYGFSDEPVSSDNEIISLDLTGPSTQGGITVTKNGQQFIVSQVGQTYIVYTVVADQTYRVKGPVEQKDLVMFMADSIVAVESSEG